MIGRWERGREGDVRRGREMRGVRGQERGRGEGDRELGAWMTYRLGWGIGPGTQNLGDK